MDINLLAMNVGNSRLALGAFVAGELVSATRIAHGQRGDWPGSISDMWNRVYGRDPVAIVGASVNPGLTEPLERAVEQAANRRIVWVGRDIDLPIKVLTKEPEKTGIDRILNIAAAYEQIEKACVVVDAGTALTVSCCDDDGAFVGGAILPGAELMLSSLHERIPTLPRVELHAPASAFGDSTREAILQGVYHGLRGAVKELVELYATELGQWPEMIATGGDARQLFDGWELLHAISPDLTLYGIALAYAEHHIKHGMG